MVAIGGEGEAVVDNPGIFFEDELLTSTAHQEEKILSHEKDNDDASAAVGLAVVDADNALADENSEEEELRSVRRRFQEFLNITMSSDENNASAEESNTSEQISTIDSFDEIDDFIKLDVIVIIKVFSWSQMQDLFLLK